MDVRGEHARHKGWLQRRNRNKAKEQEQGSKEEERQVGGARWEERGRRPDKGARCHLSIAVFYKTALLIPYFMDEETEAQERCLV